MAIAKGTPVRQIVIPIEGVIDSYSLDEMTGEIQYCVSREDGDGNIVSSFFKEDQLEVIV